MNHSKKPWALAVNNGAVNTKNRLIPLPDVGRVMIGRSIDCDVVLRELDDATTVITLHCDRPKIQVEGCGESFALTSSGLNLESLHLAVEGVIAPESVLSDTAPNLAEPCEREETAVVNSEPALVDGAQATTWWQGRTTLVAGIAMMASVALLGWQVSAFSGASTVNPQVVMEQYLAENELSHINVESDSDSDAFTLVGRVNERSELLALERFVKEQKMNSQVGLHIMDGQSTRSQIEDLFRVNGVSATTAFDEAGMLWVNTSVADDGVLDNLRNVVSSDMPILKHWDIANTPPEVDVPLGPIDPGKQVAMVVSDEPAFVLTADQTRYFVGSLLPTGHRISAIESGRVILEKDGDTSELEF